MLFAPRLTPRLTPAASESAASLAAHARTLHRELHAFVQGSLLFASRTLAVLIALLFGMIYGAPPPRPVAIEPVGIQEPLLSPTGLDRQQQSDPVVDEWPLAAAGHAAELAA
ncbi:hypothetical protein VVD49_01750 [Uliginosibacterium sp. H3]|uniref:Uncharacterized protein n=1 Tax=Uliginosibacterium silvisoli TaxID=3114758 RepID=A0ABU6JZN5_9RHOO|nr:hypothetical protein [Uliginosibacterium sp. H3]